MPLRDQKLQVVFREKIVAVFYQPLALLANSELYEGDGRAHSKDVLQVYDIRVIWITACYFTNPINVRKTNISSRRLM